MIDLSSPQHLIDIPENSVVLFALNLETFSALPCTYRIALRLKDEEDLRLLPILLSNKERVLASLHKVLNDPEVIWFSFPKSLPIFNKKAYQFIYDVHIVSLTDLKPSMSMQEMLEQPLIDLFHKVTT
jgi:hypothetical protein